MRTKRWMFLIFCIVVLAVPALSAEARRATVTCERAQPGSVLVDGVTTDWEGSSATVFNGKNSLLGSRSGWSGASDLSTEVRCLYTKDKLFFLIKTRDEYVVRFKKLKPAQDRLLLIFQQDDAKKTFAIYPPDGRQKPAYGWLPTNGKGRRRRRRRSRRRRRKKLRLAKASGVTAAVFRLERGHAVEMSMENNVVPGYAFGSPALKLSIVLEDVDSKANAKVETRMGTGGDGQTGRLGRVDFAEAKALLARFLQDQGFSSSRIKINRVGNFVGGKSLERVVIAGKKIAVLGGDITGGGYFYMSLPVHKESHILRFAVRDMNKDGQDEILVRLAQMKNNRGREILVIYRFDNRRLLPIFGHEVAHKAGNMILTNKYRYIKTKNGIDMEFKVGKNVGFTERNHQSSPPQNLEALLTPWGDKKKVRYRFTSDSYVEVD